MDRILLLVVALFAVPAGAQTIYKCAGPKGDKVYQSFPCGGDKPAEKQWHTEAPTMTYEEYQTRVAADRKIERDRRHMRKRSAELSQGVSAPVGVAVGSSRSGSACEVAKASRASTLESVGLNRTFELLRQLDDMVWRACN